MKMGTLEAAIEAAVAAGNLLSGHYNDALHPTNKESLRDIVTEIDKIAEESVVRSLRRRAPAIPALTEESGWIGAADHDTYWVVDALDGTVNYVNRIPYFAVSIALIQQGKPTTGVIFNPMMNDLYYGSEKVGVFKNQSRLRVTDKPAPECLFSVAFSGKSYDPGRRADEFLLMQEMNDNTRGCLRTGSASMNLAQLADGRLGGCWGKANKFWDVAAGLLLARLAGARVQCREVDKDRRLVNYLAAVPAAWQFAASKTADVLAL